MLNWTSFRSRWSVRGRRKQASLLALQASFLECTLREHPHLQFHTSSKLAFCQLPCLPRPWVRFFPAPPHQISPLSAQPRIGKRCLSPFRALRPGSHLQLRTADTRVSQTARLRFFDGRVLLVKWGYCEGTYRGMVVGELAIEKWNHPCPVAVKSSGFSRFMLLVITSVEATVD